MGNVISGGGEYFAGKFKLGKIEGQLLAGDEKAGFGPSKPCPPGEDCSDTESKGPNPKQVNTLPNYDKTSVKGSASGDGGSSSTSSISSTGGGGSSTSNYDAVVAGEGTKIVDPSKITTAMTTAANKKRAEAKAKDASISQSKSSGDAGTNQKKQSISNSSSTENIVLGDQTAKQIETGGQTKYSGRISEIAAKKEHELNVAAKDSTNKSNALYKSISSTNPNRLQNQGIHNNIARASNAEAQKSLYNSKLFTRGQIADSFSGGKSISGGDAGTRGNIGEAKDFQGRVINTGPNKSGLKQTYGLRGSK